MCRLWLLSSLELYTSWDGIICQNGRGLKKQTKKVDFFPPTKEVPSISGFTSLTLMSLSLNRSESIISTHIHIKLWNKDIFYLYCKEDSGFIAILQKTYSWNQYGRNQISATTHWSIQHCSKETQTLLTNSNTCILDGKLWSINLKFIIWLLN